MRISKLCKSDREGEREREIQTHRDRDRDRDTEFSLGTQFATHHFFM